MTTDTRHTRSEWKVIAVMFLVGMPTWGVGLYDGIAPKVDPSDRSLQSTFAVFLVVSAEELNDGPHCNANPPRGIFTVHEQVRGYVDSRKVELVWYTMSEEKDHVPWSEGMPYGWRISYEDRPGMPDWQQIALPPPHIGEKIIVFAATTCRPLSVSDPKLKGLDCIRAIQKEIARSKRMPFLVVLKAFAYSEHNRHVVRDNMGPTDRAPSTQRLIVLLLLTLPGSSVALLIMSLCLQHHKRRPLLTAAVVVAGLAFPLYVYYEMGILTGGIRLDVLIIYPALTVCLVVFVIAFILRRCSEGRSGTKTQSQ